MAWRRRFVFFLDSIGVYFIYLLNAGTFSLGVFLFYAGIQLRDQLEQYEDIITLLDLVEIGSFTFTELTDLAVRIILGTGISVVIISIFGILATRWRSVRLLSLYIYILTIVLISQLVALGYWNKIRDWIEGPLEEKLDELFALYQGPFAPHIPSIGWNIIFLVLQCCGVAPITSKNNDFEALSTPWWNDFRGEDVIPSSCCENATIQTFMSYIDTSCTQNLMNYYTSGCYDTFQELYSVVYLIGLAIFLTLIIIQLLAIFFSGIIAYVEIIKRREEEEEKSKEQTPVLDYNIFTVKSR